MRAALLVLLTTLILLTAVVQAADLIVIARLNSTEVVGASDIGLLFLTGSPLMYEIVGAVILVRQPRNVIAWLLCLFGASFSCGVFISNLTTYEYKIEHAHGAIILVPAVISNVIFAPVFLSLAALLMLFPTGRAPGSWWGRIFLGGAASSSLCVFLGVFSAGTLDDVPVKNPLAVSFVPSALHTVAFLIIFLMLPLGLVGLVRRFWRAHGEERQQLKWFTYGCAMLIVCIAIATQDSISAVLEVPFFLALTFMPIATGIAIAKYRLWDIDVLINRTLLYGGLTILLGGIYVLGVLAMQSVLRVVTGQGSAIAVAVTTLVVAALFGPLRRRMQQEIDRRFYRRRYDAAQTLTALGARLRDEVDLGNVSSEVLSVLRETMEPAHASLLLLPTAVRRSSP